MNVNPIAFFIGMLSGGSDEVDVKSVDISYLEDILREAKHVQRPKWYDWTEVRKMIPEFKKELSSEFPNASESTLKEAEKFERMIVDKYAKKNLVSAIDFVVLFKNGLKGIYLKG